MSSLSVIICSLILKCTSILHCISIWNNFKAIKLCDCFYQHVELNLCIRLSVSRLYPSLAVYPCLLCLCGYLCIFLCNFLHLCAVFNLRISSICLYRSSLRVLASVSNLGHGVWYIVLQAKLLSEEGFRARMSVAMEMAQSCCVCEDAQPFCIWFCICIWPLIHRTGLSKPWHQKSNMVDKILLVWPFTLYWSSIAKSRQLSIKQTRTENLH